MSKKIKLRRLFKAEYCALVNAIHRCHNEASPSYSSYGARGIQVCDQWRSKIGFYLFFDHIGPRPGPGYSLDRIDNNKGYEPGNVRWADRRTQRNNTRRRSHKVTDYGWGIGYAMPQSVGVGYGRRPSALVPYEGRIQTIAEW